MNSNIYAILSALATSIRTAYPVFAVGYPYAKMDSSKGLVMSANDGEYIAFVDTKGNYFYIRTGNDISVGQSAKTTFEDCSAGLVETYPCTLIAMLGKEYEALSVKDALASQILANGHIVRKQSVDAVSIIRKELSGIDKKSIEAAIARFDRYIAVQIDFDVQRSFTPGKCTIDLCKSC